MSDRICLARLQAAKAALIDSAVFIFQIGGLIALLHLKALSVTHSFYLIGCAWGVPSIIYLLHVRHDFSLKIGHVFADLNTNVAFGKWVLGGNVCVLISNQIYLWLITSFHGVQLTGELAACMGIIGIFNPIYAGIGNIIGPKSAHAYAKGGFKELDNTVLVATVALGITSGIFCLGLLLFADKLMTLFYGVGYSGNRDVVSIMSLGVLVTAISSGIDYGLWAVGEADKNFRANLFCLGVSLTVGVLLVKTVGLMGVALGILLGNGGASIIRYLFYKRMKRRAQKGGTVF